MSEPCPTCGRQPRTEATDEQWADYAKHVAQREAIVASIQRGLQRINEAASRDDLLDTEPVAMINRGAR